MLGMGIKMNLTSKKKGQLSLKIGLLNKVNKKKHLILLVIILSFIFVFWAFYNGLVVNKNSIISNRLNSNETVRVALITDLHSHIYGEKQTKIITLIKQQKPDIIALAGDIADDETPIEGTIMFLESLKGICPIYYVTGNHEFWSNDIKNIKDTIKKCGVNILENEYEQIKIRNTNIIIAGIDDPDAAYYEKPNLDIKMICILLLMNLIIIRIIKYSWHTGRSL